MATDIPGREVNPWRPRMRRLAAALSLSLVIAAAGCGSSSPTRATKEDRERYVMERHPDVWDKLQWRRKGLAEARGRLEAAEAEVRRTNSGAARERADEARAEVKDWKEQVDSLESMWLKP